MSSALLTDNDRKEQLSQAYVAALASHCGFTFSIPSLDRDSIDVQVSSGTSRRASVQFQLKATSSPDWEKDELKFQLKAKNYHDLIAVRQVPLLFAIMVLPKADGDWLKIDPKKLVMKQCMWWLNLIGRTAIDQGSLQIRVPKANLLTTDALADLIQRSEDNML